MTLSVTHSYVSSVGETTPSGGPGGTVGPTEWNANHTLTGTVSPAQGGTGITSGLGITFFSSATVIADSGTLSTNQLVVGGGPNGAPTTIGSLGTTSQVLHGNASGNPSFGAVNLGSEVAGTLSTGNLQTATTAVFGIVKPDNTTVTISSGVLSASGGTSGQVIFNNSGLLAGMSGTSWDNTNLALTITGSTALSASNPILKLTQGWNSGGTAFTAWLINVTNTASANTSKLLDLQVGGTSQFVVDESGNIYTGTTAANAAALGGSSFASGGGLISIFNGSNQVCRLTTLGLQNASSIGVGWGAGAGAGSSDTVIYRVTNGVVEFTQGTAGNHDGFIQWGGQARVTANVTSTTTSLANITGLTATLANGRNYSFSCEVIGTCSSSGGIQLALNTTSTSTGYTLLIDGYAIDGGNTVRGYSQQTAVGSAVIASTITNTSFHASLWGTITTSSSMVVNFQMAQQNLSATQTIAQRGSHAFFHDMP